MSSRGRKTVGENAKGTNRFHTGMHHGFEGRIQRPASHVSEMSFKLQHATIEEEDKGHHAVSQGDAPMDLFQDESIAAKGLWNCGPLTMKCLVNAATCRPWQLISAALSS